MDVWGVIEAANYDGGGCGSGSGELGSRFKWDRGKQSPLIRDPIHPSFHHNCHQPKSGSDRFLCQPASDYNAGFDGKKLWFVMFSTSMPCVGVVTPAPGLAPAFNAQPNTPYTSAE